MRELARRESENKPAEWKDRPANWNEEKEAKYQHELSYMPMPEKPSWSEEDEKVLAAISKALGCDTAEKTLVNEGVTLMMAAGFLESLRPSWKPSEEQMDALLWCTAHLGGADHRVLAELYEHLKKLM